jgi:hypothetical protein
MKNSKPKSVIPFIKVILNIMWYMGIIVTIIFLLISILFYTGVFKDDNKGKFKFTVEDISSILIMDCKTKDVIKSKDPAFTDAIINPVDSLTFNTNDPHFILFFIFLALTYFTINFLILFHLRKIFSELPANSPFTYQNYKSIRFIAFLTIVSACGLQILKTVVSFFLSAKYAIEVKLNIGTPSILTFLILGLIILAISEIFNHGIKLKEEQDLTV